MDRIDTVEMSSFSYKALKPDGAVIEGTLEGGSRSEVLQKLSGNGLQPVVVRPIEKATTRKKGKSGKAEGTALKQSKETKEYFGEKIRLSHKQVIYFTEELSDMLGADVPLLQALKSISERTTGDAVRDVATFCREEVKQGTNLATALRKSSDSFSRLYCSLVAAGEAGGGLGRILKRQVSYLNTMADLRAKLITAMVYPAFLMVFGSLVSGVFLFYLIPRLQRLVESSGGSLPPLAEFLISAGEFLKGHWIVMLLLLVALIMAAFWFARSAAYRKKWDEIKLKLPLVGRLLSTQFNVQFSETLANLLENGMPLSKALVLTETATENEYIQDRLAELRQEHEEGSLLFAAMKKVDVFEPGLIDMVRIGDHTGSLAKSLSKAGERLDREFEKGVERAMAFVQPVILLVMAIVVGSMAFMMISLINETISTLRTR